MINEHVTRSGKVSLTVDAWSSRIYNGYMIITLHWINSSWVMKSATLHFHRFHTPQTGDSASIFIYEVIKEWNLLNSIQSITTYNAADIRSAVKRLFQRLHGNPPTSQQLKLIHVRCVAHTLDLAVKECMKEIHTKTDKILHFINCIRCSVKRREVLVRFDCNCRWNVNYRHFMWKPDGLPHSV